uniref:Uncharacterized protein n=1 Tax=Otus sunia TaxID=257818 RepID=A0A8C8ABR4_9STRI
MLLLHRATATANCQARPPWPVTPSAGARPSPPCPRLTSLGSREMKSLWNWGSITCIMYLIWEGSQRSMSSSRARSFSGPLQPPSTHPDPSTFPQAGGGLWERWGLRCPEPGAGPGGSESLGWNMGCVTADRAPALQGEGQHEGG